MLPLPPPDLPSRAPRLLALAPGTALHRFHAAAFEPVFFDRSRLGRMNAPDGRYGVLYAALGREGAFAETFLRTPGLRLIDGARLRAKAYADLVTTDELRLVQLLGPGLAVLGATAEVTHGGLPYDAPQAWSGALHDHPARADGIAFTARHDDGEVSCALFERAAGKVVVRACMADLDADWFWRIAARYDVGFAPG